MRTKSKSERILYYVDSNNESVGKGVAIRRDENRYYVLNYGYVPNNLIFENEGEAKSSLRSLLESRLQEIQAKLQSMDPGSKV